MRGGEIKERALKEWKRGCVVLMNSGLFHLPKEYVLFGLFLLLRTTLTGLSYLPMLDDFIQYRVFSFYPNTWNDVVLRIGLLSSRPLAGLSDAYIWTKFWAHLGLALFVITALYFFACIFYYQVFRRLFGCGWTFFLIAGLLPLNLEGTYWMSASTRVVLGLFFGGAAALLLLRLLDSEGTRPGLIVLFGLCTLCSYGFYEQTAAVNFFCLVLVVLCRGLKKKRYLWAVPLVSGGMIAYCYLFVRTGASNVMTSRMDLIGADFLEQWGKLFSQIGYVFGPLNLQIIGSSFLDSFKIMFREGKWFLLPTALVACVLCYFVLIRHKESTLRWKPQLFWGVALFFMGLAPFFVLRDSVLTLRGAAPSLLGLALLVDLAVRGLIKNKRAQAILISAVAFVFVLGSAAEVYQYHACGATDQENLAALSAVILQEGYQNLDRVAVIGAPAYYEDNGVRFHEHRYAITSSQWALSGALRAVSDDQIQNAVYPIYPDSPVFYGYDEFENYDAFLGYTGVEPVLLNVKWQGEGEYYFYERESGRLFAHTTFDGKQYHMIMEPVDET